MSTEKYFSIIVDGPLSSEAEEGEIDKVSGLPSGPTSKIRLQVGGTAIPNFSKVWAERIKDPKTKAPTGELKFLKWQAEGGELVQIRYLEGINTLDKLHQDTVLKVGPKSEEDINATAYIDLNVGINDFNVEATDPMLIEMLKHHTYNTGNISRNPHSKEGHFSIYDPKKLNGSKVDQLREDKKAQDIILSAEGDSARLMVMATIFELDVRAQDEVIFNDLLEILESDKKRIHDVVNLHKTRFKFILTKLEDAHDLEYTDTDVIVTIDHNRDFLAKDIEVKDKKNYLVENILEPEIFEVYQKALEIDKALVEQLN